MQKNTKILEDIDEIIEEINEEEIEQDDNNQEIDYVSLFAKEK